MASAKLTRTFTAGNRKTYTISLWLKSAGIGSSPNYQAVFLASGGDDGIFFKNDNTLDCFFHSVEKRTNRVFMDNNAWYHIMVAVDTTQASASNRLKIYVNGEQETSFAYNSGDPAQDSQNKFNKSGGTNLIGNHSSASYNFDGQLAHVHYVDGTAYTPTTFGETDSTTGIWKPKTAPSVTYGTNGFFLKFDNSANMGLDSAGSNNLTTTGTIIQNKDTPSNVFACLNPSARRITTNAPTYKNVNNTLQGQTGNGQNNNVIATLGDLAKGKYYFECKVQTVGDDFGVGICDDPVNSNGSLEGNHEILYKNDGTKWNGSSYVSYGASYTTGDIIGCAFDVTAGTISFYKNGVSQGTAATDLASSLVHGYTPGGYTNKGVMEFNFGNGYFGTTAVASAQNPTDGVGIFEYTPPTNYRAVCTKSINAQEYS